MSEPEVSGQPEGQFRESDEQHQNDEYTDKQPSDPTQGAFNGYQGYAARNHQIHRQRWGELPEGHHDGENDAEPYGVPAIGVGDGHEQGDKNQEDGDSIQKHADDG